MSCRYKRTVAAPETLVVTLTPQSSFNMEVGVFNGLGSPTTVALPAPDARVTAAAQYNVRFEVRNSFIQS